MARDNSEDCFLSGQEAVGAGQTRIKDNVLAKKRGENGGSKV